MFKNSLTKKILSTNWVKTCVRTSVHARRTIEKHSKQSLVKENIFEKGVTLHQKCNSLRATFCGSFGFVSDALIISAAQKKISAFCI